MADSIPITPALHQFWKDVSITAGTYDEIEERGGPSQPTLTKLQQGRGTISAKSAAKLEEALQLEEGSIREIAQGSDPRWQPIAMYDDASSQTVRTLAQAQEHSAEHPEQVLGSLIELLTLAQTIPSAKARNLLLLGASVTLAHLIAQLGAADDLPTDDDLGYFKDDFGLAARTGSIPPHAALGYQGLAGEESQVGPDDD